MRKAKLKIKGIDYADLILAALTAANMLYNAIMLLKVGRGAEGAARYSANATEAFGAMILILAPMFLRRKLKLKIPLMFEIIVEVLIVGGMVLGDCLDFYAIFPQWDSVLHVVFGYMLAYFGIMLAQFINRRELKSGGKLNAVYLAVFALSFGMLLGAFWELIEFVYDDLCGVNSQQFMATTRGTYYTAEDLPLVGHEALRDTMKDLLLDLIGSSMILLFIKIQHTIENHKYLHFVHQTGSPSESETPCPQEGSKLVGSTPTADCITQETPVEAEERNVTA